MKNCKTMPCRLRLSSRTLSSQWSGRHFRKQLHNSRPTSSRRCRGPSPLRRLRRQAVWRVPPAASRSRGNSARAAARRPPSPPPPPAVSARTAGPKRARENSAPSAGRRWGEGWNEAVGSTGATVRKSRTVAPSAGSVSNQLLQIRAVFAPSQGIRFEQVHILRRAAASYMIETIQPQPFP